MTADFFHARLGNIATAILCLFCAVGCTTISISGPQPDIEHRFGIVRIDPSGNSRLPQVIYSKGVGLFFGKNSITFGYFSEASIRIPDLSKCSLVIFSENREQLSELIAILNKGDRVFKNACLTSKEGELWYSEKED